MKFLLEIELGNEAMSRTSHVSEVLRKVAKMVDEAQIRRLDGSRIMDVNGNTVGKWEFTERARIVIDDLPDPEENPSMKELNEVGVRQLFYDALGEFIDNRIPMREYLDKRYPTSSGYSDAFRQIKLEEVSHRTTWASLIRHGDVRLEK